uniref:Uncharacterized protein AlNc14C54G4150 n=1 Tax=Albugo laibachii Nc14 TaxID=890382 RepID=F0WBW2_9STRA|nr:conserved hypothetical protein [Albugo laibachii Nc14]|eukprot:CCA18641.1 conserved hypothetical protein [Albugo laibachii Nc14]
MRSSHSDESLQGDTFDVRKPTLQSKQLPLVVSELMDRTQSENSNLESTAANRKISTQIKEAAPRLSPLELLDQEIHTDKLEILMLRVTQLQTDNQKLTDVQRKNDQETSEVVSYLQQEIHKRDMKVAHLSEKLAISKLKTATEVTALKQSKDFSLAKAEEYHKTQREKWDQELIELRKDVQQLEPFRDLKNSMHAEINQLQELLKQEHASSEKALVDTERHHLEEKAKLQREYERKFELVKQQAREDARNGLDADTRKIISDNRRMNTELQFQLQITEELHKDKQERDEQAKELALERQISRDKEQEYASQAGKQQRVIRQLQKQVQEVQVQLSQSLQVFEHYQHTQQKKVSKATDEKAIDVEGLRQLIFLKNKELRQLRHLSQAVLNQRTLVEKFLLESIELVRQELIRERKQEIEAKHSSAQRALRMYNAKMEAAEIGEIGRIRFPHLSPRALIADTEMDKSKLDTAVNDIQKQCDVDLRQLSWEERERILRALFAKINGYQTASLSPTANLKPQQVNQDIVYFATEPVNQSDTLVLTQSPVHELSREAKAATVSGTATRGSAQRLRMTLLGLPNTSDPMYKSQ